nr:sialic acid-binding Ig-like lectin 12 [Oncorhynchus nerka]
MVVLSRSSVMLSPVPLHVHVMLGGDPEPIPGAVQVRVAGSPSVRGGVNTEGFWVRAGDRKYKHRRQPQLPPPPTASPWTIAFSPAKITGEKGLCAVISCTFNHAENFKPTAAIWFKCPKNGKCDQDENIIIHSETPSEAQEGYEQKVSLLETDLTKKNCSVIINDIRENDTGEYQFRLLSAYTYPKKVKITVKVSNYTVM